MPNRLVEITDIIKLIWSCQSYDQVYPIQNHEKGSFLKIWKWLEKLMASNSWKLPLWISCSSHPDQWLDFLKPEITRNKVIASILWEAASLKISFISSRPITKVLKIWDCLAWSNNTDIHQAYLKGTNFRGINSRNFGHE